MRKISELDAESFFDVIYTLSPLIPILCDTDIVKAQFFRIYSDEFQSVQNKLSEAAVKETPENVLMSASVESANIIVRDISKLIPLLTSKENRGIIFETLAIIEQKKAADIKKYTPPQLISKIKQLISDPDLASFLTYAESPEPTE